MKTNYLKHILPAVLVLASCSMFAQTLHSIYFLEGNNQRNQLNPAFTSDSTTSAYITFPGMGNIYCAGNSNVGLKAFMRPQGDEMITFLNSSISTDDALAQFKSNNVIESDIDINIFTVGFKALKGTNTIGISARSLSGAYIPKEVFTFLKSGQTGEETQYDINKIDAVTQNYIELAFGHAHDINKKVSVGAKLKVLLGAAYAKAHVENMSIYMSDTKWTVTENSTFYGSKGMRFEDKDNGEVDKIKFGNWGLAGFGLGLDMGVIYRITPLANISFAITDLGFISWNNCITASNKNKEFTYEGFDNIAKEDNPDGSNDFDDAADDIWKRCKDLVRFNDDGKTGKTSSLYTTLRAAGEYGIINNKISFGMINSLRVGAPKAWYETMIVTNFRPSKWFNAAINGSLSNIRSSMGATLNFHSKTVNYFIGGDYLLAKYSKQFIPINAAKFSLAMGLSFNI